MNCATIVLRIRNPNFFLTVTVCTCTPVLYSQIECNVTSHVAEEIQYLSISHNTHNNGNTYIIAANIFSMEALSLIKGINSIFRNLCYSI